MSIRNCVSLIVGLIQPNLSANEEQLCKQYSDTVRAERSQVEGPLCSVNEVF
jgi:hypothetical protein